MSERGWNRCIYCNKFFSLKDCEDDKIGTYYQPDTVYTSEKIEQFHKACEDAHGTVDKTKDE
jgi:hypothetical protein